MRPKKPRFLNGIQLADNLYPDNKGRPGYYRYRHVDGRFVSFQAESVEHANAAAEEASKINPEDLPSEGSATQRHHLRFHTPLYFAYMEKINSKLVGKSNWQGNKYLINAMADHFDRLQDITHESLKLWWDERTYFQQKQGLAPYRRFFNWLMGEGLLPKIRFNPFTLSDDVARLLVKLPTEKKRPPLTQIGYRRVRQAAGELGFECLQLAMGISLYTSLRQNDVVTMRFDKHIIDGELRVVVGKSEAQLGEYKAARYCWKLSEHPRLKKLIDRARELSLVNKRCPFVISHTPLRRVWNEEKEHICQVTGDRLSRMFADARNKAFHDQQFTKENPGTSFHEVRGLSSTLYKLAGYTNTEIQHLMAHEDVDTTIGYQDADSLPFETITMKLEVEL